MFVTLVEEFDLNLGFLEEFVISFETFYIVFENCTKCEKIIEIHGHL